LSAPRNLLVLSGLSRLLLLDVALSGLRSRFLLGVDDEVSGVRKRLLPSVDVLSGLRRFLEGVEVVLSGLKRRFLLGVDVVDEMGSFFSSFVRFKYALAVEGWEGFSMGLFETDFSRAAASRSRTLFPKVGVVGVGVVDRSRSRLL